MTDLNTFEKLNRLLDIARLSTDEGHEAEQDLIYMWNEYADSTLNDDEIIHPFDDNTIKSKFKTPLELFNAMRGGRIDSMYDDYCSISKNKLTTFDGVNDSESPFNVSKLAIWIKEADMANDSEFVNILAKIN